MPWNAWMAVFVHCLPLPRSRLLSNGKHSPLKRIGNVSYRRLITSLLSCLPRKSFLYLPSAFQPNLSGGVGCKQHLSLGFQGHLLWDRIHIVPLSPLDPWQAANKTPDSGVGPTAGPQPWEKAAFSVLDVRVISILLMSPLHCPLLLSFFVPILTLPRLVLLSPHGTTHLPLLFLFLFFQSSPLLSFQHLGKDCNWKKYE